VNTIIRNIVVVILLGVIATVWDGFYVLPEGKQAVVTQFGAPVGDPVSKAGLHLKTPFVQDVTYFSKKILIWDGDPNQIPTNDKTFVFLDVSARWRISEPLVFLQAVNNETRAMTILDDIIDSTVRDLVNKNDLVEIIRSSDWQYNEDNGALSGEVEVINLGRDKMEDKIHELASAVTPKYGIELIDVMFKRVNYIETVRLKVYERMISERKRIAAEKRATGEGQKAEILGRVGRELKQVTSGAIKESEQIKGTADAQATRIYAEAYSQDPEFYGFIKTLESYEASMGKNTKLIVSSDSEFYSLLKGINQK
jgi:membrane protease subunit HflC